MHALHAKRVADSRSAPLTRRAIAGLILAPCLAISTAHAQTPATQVYHLRAQPLNKTLLTIAGQSGIELAYDPALVASIDAAPVDGKLSPAEAIRHALSGTGLELVEQPNRSLAIRRTPAPVFAAPKPAQPVLQQTKAPASVPVVAVADTPVQLETITVVAAPNNRRGDPQRAPTSTYRIEGSDLAEHHATSLADLQQFVPGLNVQTTDPSDTQLTIRGIGDGGGQTSGEANIGMPSSVALYVDNVYLPRPGALGAVLSDIDYIDVLSGAQGTIFGANSTGGVVDIHTTPPSFKTEASESISVGERGFLTDTTILSGPISDTLAGRIEYSHVSTDGNVTNVADGDNLNGRSSNAVRGQLLFKPDARFSLRLSGDYTNENDTPTAVTYASHTIGTSNPYLTHSALVGNKVVYGGDNHDVFLDNTNSIHFVQTGASAEADYKFDNGYNIRSVTAYRYFNYLPSFSDSLSVPVYADSGTQILDRSWEQDIRLDSPHGEFFDYALGATYLGENEGTLAYTRYGNSKLPGLYYGSTSYNGLTVIRDGTLHDEMYSGFGQGTFHVTPQFDIVAGLRLSYDKKGGEFIRYNKAPIDSGYLIQYDTLPSATLDFKYQLSQRWSTYLALAYGEKSGGLNVSAGAAKTAGDDSLYIRPEHTKSAELGIKGDLLNGTISGKADVFLTYVSDFQTQGFDPSTDSTYLMNAGTFRSRGVEGTVQYVPDNHFEFDFGAVYNDARYLRYSDAICAPEVALAPNPPASCNLSGSRVFNAPRLTLTTTARYGFTMFDSLESYVSARYSYRTWMYGTVDDSSYTRIPGYGLVSLSAGTGGHAGHGRWSAQIWVNNLFNKTYYTRLVESDYGSVLGWVGDSRTAGVTLTYQF